MITADFRAALFDLDGTILDSMNVWGDVDRVFFARRGLSVPEDYSRAISGMSYMRTAQYTKQRFDLPDSPEQIAAEWTDISRVEYARHVLLKPGARELLNWLKARGVRMAVVTALVRDLYEPCLKRNGVYDMFDTFLSTDEVGSAGKHDGRIYAAAAEKLGVMHAECAVFEDVYEGISAAKQMGMRAYCVIDARSTHRIDEIKALADGWADCPGGFISLGGD